MFQYYDVQGSITQHHQNNQGDTREREQVLIESDVCQGQI